MEERIKTRLSQIVTKLRWVLYPCYFLLVFMLVLYWTFPISAIKGFIAQKFEESLAVSGSKRATVRIGDMSLWRLSGVRLDDVAIRIPSEDENDAAQWAFDVLKIRFGIFSTLFGHPKFEFASRLSGGSISGSVVLTKNNSISDLDLQIAQLSLDKLSGSGARSALPIKGVVNANAMMHAGKDIAVDGKGEMDFSVKDFAIGPGQAVIPGGQMPGGVNVPKINFGDFSGELRFAQGKGQAKDILLKKGDLEAHLNLAVDLANKLAASKISGDGWFKVSSAFLDKNPQVKTLFELVPELRDGKDAQGRYSFAIEGTLQNPRPRLGKSSMPNKVPLTPLPEVKQ